MDFELLFALFFLWTATTVCLVLFIWIIWKNQGAFHPHSVDVDLRHNGFIVVKAGTQCKKDCTVKSISAFIAPRGSSSSKYFGSILVVISISGMFGSFRWFMMGDADITQMLLAVTGFSFLLLICAFESDVSPDRFLEDKLMITSWFLEFIGADQILDFPLTIDNSEYRNFIYCSKRLRPLFEEFDGKLYSESSAGCLEQSSLTEEFPYKPWWAVLHMLGALSYLACVTAAIILNDVNDDHIYGTAYVMVSSFALFSILGYLSGTYLPLLKSLKGIVLVWNPFCRDPSYFESLRESVVDYQLSISRMNDSYSEIDSAFELPQMLFRRKGKGKKQAQVNDRVVSLHRSAIVSQMLKNDHLFGGKRSHWIFQALYCFIRERPDDYLRAVSSIFVLLELIALLTPTVALGLQWVTALCPGPPMQSLLDLISASYSCLSVSSLEDCEGVLKKNCVLRM